MNVVLLTVTIAPVAAIIYFVYIKDKYHKEPASLLVLAFFLGILSIVPAAIGSQMGGEFFYVSSNPLMTFIYAFGVVALCEELAKYVFLRYVIFNKKAFNEPYDGIVYAVMISMGFACFENILYVVDGGLQTALLRMFTAVPAHAVFGVAMGYWVGLAKFDKEHRKALLARGLTIAILLHGGYDFFLMQGDPEKRTGGLFAISFIGLYYAIGWSMKAIKKHAELSPFKAEEGNPSTTHYE